MTNRVMLSLPMELWGMSSRILSLLTTVARSPFLRSALLTQSREACEILSSPELFATLTQSVAVTRPTAQIL
jgi:hypothetical protein